MTEAAIYDAVRTPIGRDGGEIHLAIARRREQGAGSVRDGHGRRGVRVQRQARGPVPHMNANAGAIALGHPLRMSGARLVTTATLELHGRGTRYALCTMCSGDGQGIALLIERVL